MRTTTPLIITAILCIGITLLISYLLWGSRPAPKVESKDYAPGLIEAAAKGKAASVFIMTLDSDTARYYANDQTGSGVIISEDGYIVTNHHVISGRPQIQVMMDNKHQFFAEVIGTDSLHDVALIKIPAKGLPFLEFGNSDSVRVGEPVLAVGSPYKLQTTVTSGIISGKNRDLKMSTNATANFLQTDAPTNMGNSGGALLNSDGQLIGLNVAIMTSSGQYEGFSFTIPSNLVKKIKNDLMEHGTLRRASLGFMFREVNASIAKEHNLPGIYGLVVESLTPGGGADKGGIQSLDILTSINGNTIISSAYFRGVLDEFRPGDIVEIGLLRNGVADTIEVELAESVGR